MNFELEDRTETSWNGTEYRVHVITLAGVEVWRDPVPVGALPKYSPVHEKLRSWKGFAEDLARVFEDRHYHEYEGD